MEFVININLLMQEKLEIYEAYNKVQEYFYVIFWKLGS